MAATRGIHDNAYVVLTKWLLPPLAAGIGQ